MQRLLAELNDIEKKPDRESITPGLVKEIFEYYRKTGGYQMYICTGVEHYASGYGDGGWGCGYRNMQMLCTYLLQFKTFKNQLFEGCGFVPSIPGLQVWLEKAWAKGIDKEGARQLGNSVYNSKKWIGTSEICSMFELFNIKTQIMDFYTQETTGNKTGRNYRGNYQLVEWAWKYFETGNQSNKKFCPPLYLQHAGHSRTIIGADKNLKSGEINLLLFDPAHDGNILKNDLINKKRVSMFRTSIDRFSQPAYQIVIVHDKT